MKKRDLEYEILTQKIYQLLLNQEGYDFINVEHNKKVVGKSGIGHQLDVFWEFNVAGIVHKVAIECKNYNNNISLGRIRDFQSVLEDIGNIQGLMVTKKGFQSGVIKFASFKGIGLKLLRSPIAEDWNGRLRKLTIRANYIFPKIKERKLEFDLIWIRENIEIEKLDLPYVIDKMANELWITNENGQKIKNFNQLEKGVPNNGKNEIDLEHTYKFDNGFIDVEPFGMVKLSRVYFKYDILAGEGDQVVLDAMELVEMILKDIDTGQIRFLYKDGRIG